MRCRGTMRIYIFLLQIKSKRIFIVVICAFNRVRLRLYPCTRRVLYLCSRNVDPRHTRSTPYKRLYRLEICDTWNSKIGCAVVPSTRWKTMRYDATEKCDKYAENDHSHRSVEIDRLSCYAIVNVRQIFWTRIPSQSPAQMHILYETQVAIWIDLYTFCSTRLPVLLLPSPLPLPIFSDGSHVPHIIALQLND